MTTLTRERRARTETKRAATLRDRGRVKFKDLAGITANYYPNSRAIARPLNLGGNTGIRQGRRGSIKRCFRPGQSRGLQERSRLGWARKAFLHLASGPV